MSASRNARHGQALVEFALVAPMFLLALLALIEFGRAVYYVQMLHNAAREGARYAIVHGSASGCPSGPMPNAKPNSCDPQAEYVKDTVKDYAIAIIDSGPDDFIVTACWWTNQETTYSWCPPNNASGPGTYDFGPGDNARDSTVGVRVSYAYQSFLAPFVPLPPFVLTGESTLVINH